MHLQSVWPQAVVVYPQGLDSPTPLDPSGFQPGWQFKVRRLERAGSEALRRHGRDPEAALPHRPAADLHVRLLERRDLSYLLWAERAKTIAAVGSVAGLLDASETLTVPRALIAVSGKQDAVSPFSVRMQSVERARQIDHATGSGVPCG